MNTYKITNTTNLLGKRTYRSNSDVDIQYVDNMVKKTIKLKPAGTVYLTVSSLPLSVHKLRINGLVIVSEISATELAKTMEESKPKVAVKPLIKEVSETITEVKKPSKKRIERE